MNRFVVIALLLIPGLSYAQVSVGINSPTLSDRIYGVDAAGAAASAQAASLPNILPATTPLASWALDEGFTGVNGTVAHDTGPSQSGGTSIYDCTMTTSTGWTGQGFLNLPYANSSRSGRTDMNCPATPGGTNAFPVGGSFEIVFNGMPYQGTTNAASNEMALFSSDLNGLYGGSYSQMMGELEIQSNTVNRQNTPLYETAQKMVGVHSLIVNMTSPISVCVDGVLDSNYFAVPQNWPATATTSTFTIGDYATKSAFPAEFYRARTWSTPQTQATCAANFRDTQNFLSKRGVQIATRGVSSSSPVAISIGDSMTIDLGAGLLANNTPLNNILRLMNGAEGWLLSVGGQLAATLSTYQGLINKILHGSSNGGPNIVMSNFGTNDLNAGTANGPIFTSLTGAAANVNLHQNTYYVQATIPSRCSIAANSTNETNRLALNTSIRGNVGTPASGNSLFAGVADVARDITLGNNYNTSPTFPTCASNGLVYADATHWNQLGDNIAVNIWSQAVASALGQRWYKKYTTIYYNDLLQTAATTLSYAEKGLAPGEHIYGIRVVVTTAFAGSGITALTLSNGDSTGTTTQYSNAFSLLAAGTQQTGDSLYSTQGGNWTLNFTSTGANLSALTAGAADVYLDIGPIR